MAIHLPAQTICYKNATLGERNKILTLTHKSKMGILLGLKILFMLSYNPDLLWHCKAFMTAVKAKNEIDVTELGVVVACLQARPITTQVACEGYRYYKCLGFSQDAKRKLKNAASNYGSLGCVLKCLFEGSNGSR